MKFDGKLVTNVIQVLEGEAAGDETKEERTDEHQLAAIRRRER